MSFLVVLTSMTLNDLQPQKQNVLVIFAIFRCGALFKAEMDTDHFFGPGSDPTHKRPTRDPTRSADGPDPFHLWLEIDQDNLRT